MLRIAIQAKGRLNEESVELLAEAGVSIEESKRKLLTRCDDFPLEVLYLRDDDIPQAVSMGVADVGIVGLNEVEEKGFDVKIAHKLGFGKCRISLAIPKADAYDGIGYFNGNDQTVWVMIQGLVQTLLVRLPLAYYMSIQPNASLTNIGFAAPVATIFGIALNIGFFVWMNKARKCI